MSEASGGGCGRAKRAAGGCRRAKRAAGGCRRAKRAARRRPRLGAEDTPRKKYLDIDTFKILPEKSI